MTVEAATGRKPVVLIGGTAGTGKTSLANRLLCACDLDHRLGTGFVRAILHSEKHPSDGFLAVRTFQSSDPTELVSRQATRLKPALSACIDRARAEGTSLVIEGSHLLPEVMHDLAYDAFLVLRAPSEPEHHERLNGHRHALRQVAMEELKNVRVIDDLYASQAERYGIPTLQWSGDLGRALSLLNLAPVDRA
jgi:2-phosphoglycerate kinase